MFLKLKASHQINLTSKNPYEILDIESSADIIDIEQAYKILAAKYHPDNIEFGSNEAFLLITKARDILIDPTQRSLYDEFFIFENLSDEDLYEKAKREINDTFLHILAQENMEDNINMPRALKDTFKQAKRHYTKNTNQIKNKIKVFEGAQKRLKKSKVSNMLNQSLNHLIDKQKKQLPELKRKLLILEYTDKLLEDFKYDFDEVITFHTSNFT